MFLYQWTPRLWKERLLGCVLFDISTPFHHSMIITGEVTYGDYAYTVPVCHMAPPLLEQSNDTRIILSQQHFVGKLESFPYETAQNVAATALMAFNYYGGADFTNKRFAQYTISSHTIEIFDPNNSRERLRFPRFSCASYVEWCYEEIGIDIVRESAVPVKTIVELMALFAEADPNPNVAELTEAQFRRFAKLGQAPGPWPILLPAYQMRAFDSKDPLPYAPAKEDHPFKGKVSTSRRAGKRLRSGKDPFI